MNNGEPNGMDDDIFIVDSDQIVRLELEEDRDYMVVHDPQSTDPEAWCVILLDDHYTDYVVRYDNIGINAKTRDLVYSYQVLSGDEPEDLLHFNNTLTTVLTNVLVERHKSGSNEYTDLKDIV